MDIVLVILGLVLMIAGIVGSFIPIIPGPPLSWIGLLILHITKAVQYSTTFLVVTFVIAIGIAILDYFIPAMGTKRFGGSRAGAIGTTIGLIIGLITMGPLGLIAGPFGGALVGELVFNQTDSQAAFKAATGSFIGFLASTFIKLVVATIFLGLFIYKVFAEAGALF